VYLISIRKLPLRLACLVLSYLFVAGQAVANDSSFANVRDYGAIGDGQADDTAAFLKAIAAKRGVVVVPRGKFRISQPLVVELDKTGYIAFEGHGVGQIIMAAAGPAIRFIGTHVTGLAAPQTVQNNVWENQRMPSVEGIEIVGAHEEADGIEASGTMQLTITRTRISRCRHGIHLVKQNRNIVVSDCHIYHNRGIGIYYDRVSLHQSNIVGSHISYCDGGGIVSRNSAVRNLQIGTCDIESNQGARGEPTANILLDSTQSEGTAEVAITACTIQHNSKAPNSANIRILGQCDNSKKQWGQVTITGNIFSDVTTNVHLQGVRGVTLSANTFWMGYEHDLLVEDCRHIVLTGNTMERNSAYDYIRGNTTKNAVVFRNCADCILSACSIEGVRGAEAGLLLDRCNRFNITGCSILDCDKAGVLARNLTNSRISACIIRDDRKEQKTQSIVVEGGKGNQIIDNLTNE
jgi:hypothetical protein